MSEFGRWLVRVYARPLSKWESAMTFVLMVWGIVAAWWFIFGHGLAGLGAGLLGGVLGLALNRSLERVAQRRAARWDRQP